MFIYSSVINAVVKLSLDLENKIVSRRRGDPDTDRYEHAGMGIRYISDKFLGIRYISDKFLTGR